MTERLGEDKRAGILRWVARIWSALLLIFVVLMIFFPDQQATEPVSTEDKLMLGLIGAAVLGLIIAWRWERFGAYWAIVALVLQQVLWLIIRGSWFPGFVVFWLLILPPALLYLIVWHMAHEKPRLVKDETG